MSLGNKQLPLTFGKFDLRDLFTCGKNWKCRIVKYLKYPIYLVKYIISFKIAFLLT